MKTLLILTAYAICGFAQTAGTITSTPPTAPVPAVAGKLVATAGAAVCTLTGNAVPATAITISCVVNGVSIAPYTMPLGAGAAYTFSHAIGTDSITAILKADDARAITADVVATTAAGAMHTAPVAKF